MLKKMPPWSLAALYWAWPGDGLEGVAWIAWSLILNLEHLQTTLIRSPEIDAVFAVKVRDMQQVLRPEACLHSLCPRRYVVIRMIKDGSTQG